MINKETPRFGPDYAGPLPGGGWAPMHIDGSWSDVWAVEERWSDHTFGSPSVRDHRGPLDHLKKEIEEALANPGDITEFADLLLLVFDAARRAGHRYWELKHAVIDKLNINQRRKWGKPSDPTRAVEHIR